LGASGDNVLIDITLTDNVAGADGGGLYGAWLHLLRGDVEGNSAGGDGGGAWLEGWDISLTDTDLVGNSAMRGGGLYASTLPWGDPHVAGGSLLRNVATGPGGGVFLVGGWLSFDGVDLGVATDDNLTDDVYLHGGGSGGDASVTGLGAETTVFCDARTSTCG